MNVDQNMIIIVKSGIQNYYSIQFVVKFLNTGITSTVAPWRMPGGFNIIILLVPS